MQARRGRVDRLLDPAGLHRPHRGAAHVPGPCDRRRRQPRGCGRGDSWTVDTVAPDTTIDTSPSDPSNDRSPSFEFHAGEAASFECQLDTGEWAACSSGQTYAGLTDGQHTFRVRATDRAANLGDAAARTWTVDTVAPDTTIDSAPADPSNDRAPSFELRTLARSPSFECRLDEGAWAWLLEPAGLHRPGGREHTFAGAGDRSGREPGARAARTAGRSTPSLPTRRSRTGRRH